MATIELDNEFLELFFSITNKPVPVNVALPDLKKQLSEVVEVLNNLNKTSTKSLINASNKHSKEDNEDDLNLSNAILVVDDLGVITYQLKVLLSDFEIDVDCAQEIYDAVAKYKKRKYAYVIMDLFIPTEREGFILLSELKKMAHAFDTSTIIGIITASPRKEIEQLCKVRGADFFVEKNNDWQNKLLTIMHDYIDKNDNDDDF